MSSVPPEKEQQAASIEDLESWVERLERAMSEVRHDSAAARVLSGAADRDVSEFRQALTAHGRVLNTLRETHVEQGQRIAELDRKVTDGFSTINVGMAQITALLRGAQEE